MSQLGLGVMLGVLGGNEETVAAYQAALGREISSAIIDENAKEDGAIILGFSGGGTLTIWDGGRSCCESRYITTDDSLADLVGKRLHSIEAKEGPEVEGEWDVHESMFVEITGHDGTNVVLTTHNEHNGYYGGFWLQIAAQGMEAPEGGETRSGSTEGDSPVGNADAPDTNPDTPSTTGDVS